MRLTAPERAVRVRAAAGQGRAGGGFHWTELYLGALLALLALGAVAALLWERRQRAARRDRARTAENLRFSADATWLKHLIGEVRPPPTRVACLQAQEPAPPCRWQRRGSLRPATQRPCRPAPPPRRCFCCMHACACPCHAAGGGAGLVSCAKEGSLAAGGVCACGAVGLCVEPGRMGRRAVMQKGACVPARAQDDAPSWLKNPDYERMGWVNDVIVHLWPHVAAAASVMVRDLAEPLLRQSKPRCARACARMCFHVLSCAPSSLPWRPRRAAAAPEQALARARMCSHVPACAPSSCGDGSSHTVPVPRLESPAALSLSNRQGRCMPCSSWHAGMLRRQGCVCHGSFCDKAAAGARCLGSLSSDSSHGVSEWRFSHPRLGA